MGIGAYRLPTAQQSWLLARTAGLIGGGLVAAAGLAFTGTWVPLGRRLGGRLDPTDPGHAMGLSGMVAFVIICCAPLFALEGQAPLLRLIENSPDTFGQSRSATGQILDLYYSLLWNVPLAFVMAGFPGRRMLRAGLLRLGVVPIPLQRLPVLVLCAGGLVLLSLGFDAVIGRVWELTGWPRTNEELVNRLFGAAISPVGAVSVALTAGIGEELLARGLLQPRFGWFLPNLAFAATHAFQYGGDSLLSVFVIGSVLAAVRARWNTTSSMVVHGLYDFILVVLTLVGGPGS
jgi:membrane protease YdiL (CAAX protease family)